jgi:hypothetical protein
MAELAQKNLAGLAGKGARKSGLEALVKLHPLSGNHKGFGVSAAAVLGHKVVVSGAGVRGRIPFEFVLTLDFAGMIDAKPGSEQMILSLETSGPKPSRIVAPMIPVGVLRDHETGRILRFSEFELVLEGVLLSGGPSWHCLLCLLPIAACAVSCLPFFFPPYVQYLACIAACAAEPVIAEIIIHCLWECGMFDAA